MGRLRVFVLAAFVLGLAPSVLAQSWPSKPIKIIIPFPPGNTTDIMARLIGPKIAERLGQPIIVENRPGASGMLGLDYVAKAAPDGYILAAGQGGNMVVLPHTSKNIPYDALKDFVPIAVSTTNYLGIVAYPEVPFKSVGEMISYAKANPGKLTVATNGEGGFPHLAFEHLRVMGGFTFTHVPYKGSAAIATDVIGGQVQVGIDGITGLAPHVRSGRLRLLAITNRARVPLWPDTPTAGEAVPGYESGGWFGYVAPARTPRNIILRMNEEINRAIVLPDISEKLVGAGLIIVTESPEYFANLIKSDYAKYGRLTRDIGFQPQ
ncbi:MAG TPA: tripartite tricarboxylate transporter substrate binding protein [Burkholderiales bacterium]|nr:tripartite tricarboxylate transporter substrate binding protein [Burkholderiales bacterium]